MAEGPIHLKRKDLEWLADCTDPLTGRSQLVKAICPTLVSGQTPAHQCSVTLDLCDLFKIPFDQRMVLMTMLGPICSVDHTVMRKLLDHKDGLAQWKTWLPFYRGQISGMWSSEEIANIIRYEDVCEPVPLLLHSQGMIDDLQYVTCVMNLANDPQLPETFQCLAEIVKRVPTIRVDEEKWSVISIAMRNGWKEMFAHLDPIPEACFFADEEASLLHFAQSKEAIQLCVRSGVPLDATNVNGYTALDVAIKFMQRDRVQYLLEVGCDPNNSASVTDVVYRTAVGRLDDPTDPDCMAAVLLRCGANPFSRVGAPPTAMVARYLEGLLEHLEKEERLMLCDMDKSRLAERRSLTQSNLPVDATFHNPFTLPFHLLPTWRAWFQPKCSKLPSKLPRVLPNLDVLFDRLNRKFETIALVAHHCPAGRREAEKMARADCQQYEPKLKSRKIKH
jgi:hypothetical protein